MGMNELHGKLNIVCMLRSAIIVALLSRKTNAVWVQTFLSVEISFGAHFNLFTIIAHHSSFYAFMTAST